MKNNKIRDLKKIHVDDEKIIDSHTGFTSTGHTKTSSVGHVRQANVRNINVRKKTIISQSNVITNNVRIQPKGAVKKAASKVNQEVKDIGKEVIDLNSNESDYSREVRVESSSEAGKMIFNKTVSAVSSIGSSAIRQVDLDRRVRRSDGIRETSDNVKRSIRDYKDFSKLNTRVIKVVKNKKKERVRDNRSVKNTYTDEKEDVQKVLNKFAKSNSYYKEVKAESFKDLEKNLRKKQLDERRNVKSIKHNYKSLKRETLINIKDSKNYKKKTLVADRNRYIAKQIKNNTIESMEKINGNEENNMSSGFSSFTSRILANFLKQDAKDTAGTLLKKLLKFLGIGSIGMFGFLFVILIFFLIIAFMFTTVVGFLFKNDLGVDYSSNENYFTTALSAQYRDLDSHIAEWMQKTYKEIQPDGVDEQGNPKTKEVEKYYTVKYIGGQNKNNFSDCLALYLALVSDADVMDISGEATNDIMPFLVVDTDKEKNIMQRLFSQMNYTKEHGKELWVYRLSGEEWISKYGLNKTQQEFYEIILSNMDKIVAEGGMNVISVPPGNSYSSDRQQAIFNIANQYLGYPYVWGGCDPSTSFDCSGFAWYVMKQAGVINFGRETAQGLYNACNSKFTDENQAQPGDLIFFQGTYSTSDTVTHVGIYAGDGKMIHCGNPIQYSSIHTDFWNAHFYSFGRY